MPLAKATGTLLTHKNSFHNVLYQAFLPLFLSNDVFEKCRNLSFGLLSFGTFLSLHTQLYINLPIRLSNFHSTGLLIYAYTHTFLLNNVHYQFTFFDITSNQQQRILALTKTLQLNHIKNTGNSDFFVFF